MARLRRFFLRLFNVLRPARGEPELARELTAHLTLLEDDFRRRGLTREQARLAARRALNGVEQVKELHRDARSFVWLDDARQDVRYLARTWRRSPGVALLGVVVMTLGIGANTAVFSVVNTVLLKPLPYPDSDRIVTLSTRWRSLPTGSLSRQVSGPDFEDWRRQATSFEAMAYYSTRPRAVTIGGQAEYARVSRVSPDFLRVFAMQPAVGRSFADDEVKEGAAGAALVSHAYAERRFGGSSLAVGQTIRIFNRPVDVVGVLTAGFDFPEGTDVWFPENAVVNQARSLRSSASFLAVGRLKPAVGLERARAEMTSIAARLEQEHPDTNSGRSVRAARLQDQMVGDVRLMLYVLLAAVSLVLLIACANIATLLLVRASARRREIVLRGALGASRGRIVRQMLMEGLVQGWVAGAAGLTLAWTGTRALVVLVPGDVPRLAEVALDGRVLAFTLGISVISSLLLALAPAFEASRAGVASGFRPGATRSTTGGRTPRLRDALVLLQLALAVVLLTTGGLFIRSFVALQHAPVGFRPDNVLVMDATVATSDPRQDGSLFFRDVLSAVSAVPGVLAAGATMAPPGRVDSTSAFLVDRLPEGVNLTTAPTAVMSIVAPHTFAALGIPLVRGRDFDDRDVREGPLTAIVNEALARQALSGQDPIGHAIVCGFDSLTPMIIVGIVGDVRQSGPASEPQPECYMPYLQHNYNGSTLSLVIRTAADPTLLAETVRRKAQERSPTVPVRFTTLEALTAQNIAAPRFRALLVGIFAAVALLLAVVGVFGVTAYVVSHRTAEIGLRMALGATAGDVLWLVLRGGLALAGLGLALGLAGAAVATRIVGSLLFEVEPGDPATQAIVAGVLAISSLAALYVPARRATRVDPLVALRCD